MSHTHLQITLKMNQETETLQSKDPLPNVYDELYEKDTNNEEPQDQKEQVTLIEQEKCPKIVKGSNKSKVLKLELKQTIKKQALKKPVLSTLDILISVFVVTPLVVACWRGTWVLMDLHPYYFPIWESFLIGIAAHVFLAIGQEVFHNIVIETKKNNWHFRIVSFLLMKIYTYVFLIITNLHWRGGWAIMDYYCGLEVKNRKILKYEVSVGVAAVCLVMIFLMKCLKNATAPPFAICLDKGNDMFLFPTMFRQKKVLPQKIYLRKRRPASDSTCHMDPESKLKIQTRMPQPLGWGNIYLL